MLFNAPLSKLSFRIKYINNPPLIWHFRMNLFCGVSPRRSHGYRNSVGAVGNPASVPNSRTPHVSPFDAAKIRCGDPQKTRGAHCTWLPLRELHSKRYYSFHYYYYFIMKTKSANSKTGQISPLFYSVKRMSENLERDQRNRKFDFN